MDTILQRNKPKIHPYSTQIGELIKKATDCSISHEDLGLFLHISDSVNSSEDVCKDAFKALHLRLSSSIGCSQETLWLTLLLIELLVKNGNNHLHLTVLNKEFLNNLHRILMPKSMAPISHQNKVLQMFEDWIKTLAGVPGYKDLFKIYKSLKDKRVYELANESIENIDVGSLTLSSVDQRNDFSPHQSYMRASMSLSKPPSTEKKSIEASKSSPNCVNCRSVKTAKLKLQTEFDVASEDIRILSEMIREIHPAFMEVQEAKVIGDLYRTCQSIYERMLDLTTKPNLWEDCVETVLELIDMYNNSFQDFDSFLEKINRENQILTEVIMYPSANDEKNCPVTVTNLI